MLNKEILSQSTFWPLLFAYRFMLPCLHQLAHSKVHPHYQNKITSYRNLPLLRVGPKAYQ